MNNNFNMDLRYYYHHDRLGSTTEITNLIGDVIQRYVYDSFGNTSIYNKDGIAITDSQHGLSEKSFHLYRKRTWS